MLEYSWTSTSQRRIGNWENLNESKRETETRREREPNNSGRKISREEGETENFYESLHSCLFYEEKEVEIHLSRKSLCVKAFEILKGFENYEFVPRKNQKIRKLKTNISWFRIFIWSYYLYFFAKYLFTFTLSFQLWKDLKSFYI